MSDYATIIASFIAMFISLFGLYMQYRMQRSQDRLQENQIKLDKDRLGLDSSRMIIDWIAQYRDIDDRVRTSINNELANMESRFVALSLENDTMKKKLIIDKEAFGVLLDTIETVLINNDKDQDQQRVLREMNKLRRDCDL